MQERPVVLGYKRAIRDGLILASWIYMPLVILDMGLDVIRLGIAILLVALGAGATLRLMRDSAVSRNAKVAVATVEVIYLILTFGFWGMVAFRS